MAGRQLFVIGGSNGSGKTTFAKEFLPAYVGQIRFINPDLIAAGLSPFDPSSVLVRAGRLMLTEVERSIVRGDRFAFESTLSGKTYISLLRKAKNAGYHITLFYLWLPDPALAIARIRDRVENGGHPVPDKDVVRRYDRTLKNFFKYYRQLADSVLVFNNTGMEPELICLDKDGVVTIHQNKVYCEMIQKWGAP